MHRNVPLLAAFLILVAGCALLPGPALTLPESTPAAAGLRWSECPISGSAPDGGQMRDCPGAVLPAPDGADRGRWAERTPRGQRLRIGSDTYETVEYASPLPMVSLYVLSENARPQSALFGQFTAYSPDHTLQNIGGKAVWEFAAEGRQTLIVDGRDLRRLYGLDAAFAPYELAGKLIFVGQKKGQRFVVYDGKAIGPRFDEILIAYCCEPAASTARGAAGAYVFRGTRGGQRYTVVVSPDTGENK